MSCGTKEWPHLWRSYAAAFLDDQVRVIDRDERDRTTSEGQAYAMFFALVANDRPRFDGLLRWTERNLASGDLAAHLPAWLWGQRPNRTWGVLDDNSAADADLWMAYTLIEAGQSWSEPRYSHLGTSLAQRIAAEEIVHAPNVGPMLLSGPRGFESNGTYRFNASYLPLHLVVALANRDPAGPWAHVAERVPTLVRQSSPHGFTTDWIELSASSITPSAIGSYDAIRVYLWAGMLDPSTPGRDGLLRSLPGMARHLRTNDAPPAKVASDGTVVDGRGPVGFSAALLPYLTALDEGHSERAQMARVRAAYDAKTGLHGKPARYYDQNLVLFAIGTIERQFWFDAKGDLHLTWTH